MVQLIEFRESYFNNLGTISRQFNEWIKENRDVNVIQMSSSESSDDGGHYRNTLFVLYEDKSETISLNS